LRLNNTDYLCFPCAAYELRHSSDLALLKKWPVFLQNAFGNPAYVNQANLNGKLRKKLGGQTGGQAKNWRGMAHPGPLRIATAYINFFVRLQSKTANNRVKTVGT